MEVNAFVIMSNHIHLIWQIQEGYERDAVQRNFLKFVSQTIKRDLEKKSSEGFRKVLCECKRQEVSVLGTQSIKYRLMDKRSIYTKDGIHS